MDNPEVQSLKAKLEALEVQYQKVVKKYEESKETAILYAQTIQVLLSAVRIYANEEMWAEDQDGKLICFGDGEQQGFELAMWALIEIGAVKIKEDEDG